jgi:hypothetical protein
MKKYNDTVSNKYFNSPSNSNTIQKRMNNVKSENKYYGNSIQKGWGSVLENAGRAFRNVFGSGEARAITHTAVPRTVEELNGFARIIDAAKKSAKDAGNGASVNVGKLLQQIIKEHLLEPHETAHIIQSLGEISPKAKSSYLSEYAPSASVSTSTPVPISAPASASTARPIPDFAFPRSSTSNETIASQIKAQISSSNESARSIVERVVKNNNLSYQDLKEILNTVGDEYIPSHTKIQLYDDHQTLPGAPRPKKTPEPVISATEEAEKKKRQNQYLWEHIIDRVANNRVNISELAPDEIGLIKQIVPTFTGDVLSQRQIDRIAELGGLITRPSLVAPNPKNATERAKSTSMAANSNVPYGAQPTTVRHEIVISQAPAPASVHAPEPIRAPEPAPNPFPNSPYSPEQISRYSSSFVAPQQSQRRNFWDRNSALWNAPHEYQQKVNFHANQYEDLLRGNITEPIKRHEVATDLVNRGFIPRDAANKILSDFGDEKRVAPKLNRVSSGAKNIYQNNFSTSIPLSPEQIARNERNKKLVTRAATTYGIGHYALPIAGAFIANELSKPQYTGDVNDPNFDFNEYKKTKWVRNIRDLAPDLFTVKKDVQKSASKTKKLRKGPLPAPGGSASDVDDATEAAAAQAVIDRSMPRTETAGRLMQPQEYSAADLANRRTGYGAFGNEGNHSYERVIDEDGKTNWKATQDNENNKKAKIILNWMKETAKSTAKSKLGLVLPNDSDLARRKSFSTIKNVLKPIAEGPVGKMVAQKLKNDFNIKDVKGLSNASEGVLQRALASAVGLTTYNPIKEVQDSLANKGEKLPPATFKQIADSVVDQNTQSRINVARKDMLAPFNIPKYVSASTKSRPWTAKEEKNHAENSARYHDLTRQRFEDAKMGTDLSSLNSDVSGGASRFSGMPSMGLSSRTSNDYLATNEQQNKIQQQNSWKALAWSQGKYKPTNQLEEQVLIGSLQALPQQYKEMLKPKEKNNVDRLLEFFNSSPKQQKSYLPLTPSALAGSSQPVTQTATPKKTVQQQVQATPTVQQRINTPYQNPEQLKAQTERAVKAKIQELIRQRGN